MPRSAVAWIAGGSRWQDGSVMVPCPSKSEYLTEFLQVLSNLRPYLVQCYDREEFPRTNNGHGGQYRSAEARATAVSVAARTGTPRCCATGARSPITSGGSRMPPVDSNWSSGPPGLTALAGERCVRRRPLPSMSNSRAFACGTSVRPYLLPSRHAGLPLLLLFCPDGFFLAMHRFRVFPRRVCP